MTLKFLYGTVFGRIILKIIIRPFVSKIAGSFLRSPASCLLIKNFIKKNNIDMDEYPPVKYKSFDDFFTRIIKDGLRTMPENIYDIAAPADSKLSVFSIDENSVFIIKNSFYTIKDLLRSDELADEFSGGICLIFRLSPDDYHRYIYIDDAEIIHREKIKGVLHTVRPVAYQQCTVFCQNTREYTVMKTKSFGKVVQMEVGALFVGRISNHDHGPAVKRGEEKGMFQFGGSTVILMFQKDTVSICDEINENMKHDRETQVKMGEKVGEKIR